MFPAQVRLRTAREEMYNVMNHRLLCTKHTDWVGVKDNAKRRNMNFIWIIWWETGQNNRKVLSLSFFSVSPQWQHSLNAGYHLLGRWVKMQHVAFSALYFNNFIFIWTPCVSLSKFLNWSVNPKHFLSQNVWIIFRKKNKLKKPQHGKKKSAFCSQWFFLKSKIRSST